MDNGLLSLLLAGVVWAFPARAITIDFDDLPLGATPDSFHFKGVRIHTHVSVLGPSDTSAIWGVVHNPMAHAPRSFLWDATEFGTERASAHGQIETWNGNPGVVVRAGHVALPTTGQMEDYFARIGVEFIGGVSDFSVDANSLVYTTELVYSGIDITGQSFRGSLFVGDSWDEYTHLHVTAPEGGYLTSFYFSMADSIEFPVRLNMDNLSFTPVPDTGSSIALFGASLALLLLPPRRLSHRPS